jgi:hypothetical protein
MAFRPLSPRSGRLDVSLGRAKRSGASPRWPRKNFFKPANAGGSMVASDERERALVSKFKLHCARRAREAGGSMLA